MTATGEGSETPTTGPSWSSPSSEGDPGPAGWTGPGAAPPATGYGSAPGYGGGYGAPVYGNHGGFGNQPGHAGQQPPVPGYAAALRPGVVPLRPLSLGEVFDGAFRAVRANPRVMFGLSAVVVALAVAVQSVLQWYLQGLLAAEFSRSFAEVDPNGDLGLTSSAASSVSSFLTTVPTLGIATTVLTGLLIVSVSRSVIGQVISPGAVWAKAKGRILALLGFSFGFMIASLLAFALWGWLIYLTAKSEEWALMIVVIALGSLIGIVGGLWVYVRTLLIPAVLVLEGASLRKGIARGWRLTRGSFWRLLGIYVLTNVIVAVVGGIVASPAAVISGVLFDPNDVTQFGPIAVTGAFTIVSMTLTTVFTAAVIALLYIDVRMRREGLDVALTRAASDGRAV